MYSNDQEVIKYVMNAIDEGASSQEIKAEISRLAAQGSVIDPLAERFRDCLSSKGGDYETL